MGKKPQKQGKKGKTGKGPKQDKNPIFQQKNTSKKLPQKNAPPSQKHKKAAPTKQTPGTQRKSAVTTQITTSSSQSKLSNLQAKMKEKLEGSQFRWINEQLYTITGQEALQMMEQQPEFFEIYHKGFKSQVQKWPTNPLDNMIRWLKTQPQTKIVADFGCGEAVLAQSVPQRVHSFDLVAANDSVTACDIANVPLPDSSVDIVIICLALMGTNFLDFLFSAHRVLRLGGIMNIAEVKSRFETSELLSLIQSLGFRFISKDESNTMFVLLKFEKNTTSPKKIKSQFKFKPCLYKKR